MMYLQRTAVVGDIVQRAPGRVPAPHAYDGMLTVKAHVSDTANSGTFSGLRNPVGGPLHRRAPDRLAALLTAFRLIYRVLPPSDFHGWSVLQY